LFEKGRDWRVDEGWRELNEREGEKEYLVSIISYQKKKNA
jgi:hypothetical protein